MNTCPSPTIEVEQLPVFPMFMAAVLEQLIECKEGALTLPIHVHQLGGQLVTVSEDHSELLGV